MFIGHLLCLGYFKNTLYHYSIFSTQQFYEVCIISFAKKKKGNDSSDRSLCVQGPSI